MVFPHSMVTAPGFGFPQNTQSMGMGPNGTHPSKNGFSQKSGFGRKNGSNFNNGHDNRHPAARNNQGPRYGRNQNQNQNQNQNPNGVKGKNNRPRQNNNRRNNNRNNGFHNNQRFAQTQPPRHWGFPTGHRGGHAQAGPQRDEDGDIDMADAPPLIEIDKDVVMTDAPPLVENRKRKPTREQLVVQAVEMQQISLYMLQLALNGEKGTSANMGRTPNF